MYNKTTAFQRHMLLSAEEDVAPCDSDMDCTDDSEGLAHSCQEVSMDIDMEERSSWILPLTTLMDADKDLTVESEKTAVSLSEQQPTGKRTRQTRPSKTRGPYRRYTAYQIEKLFDLVIEEGKSAKDAALITGINIRTAQHYIKKYNDDEERRLPISGRKSGTGRKAKLTESHSQFLIYYVDEHPEAVLSDIR